LVASLCENGGCEHITIASAIERSHYDTIRTKGPCSDIIK